MGGLVSLPNVQDAVPFDHGLGTRQTTLSAAEKGLRKSSRRSLKELPRSLATERERERVERARHEERSRDMRMKDPDQRPDRRAIEGTGASSSRDGAGNEPPPRPAESSASVDQPPREQNDDADMGDPRVENKSGPST